MGLNKVVLVTGASKGIGRAIATEFAERGVSDLIVTSRSMSKLSLLGDELHSTYGTTVVPLLADLTNNLELGRLIRTVERTYGRLDVLVNNAGDFVPISFDEEPIGEAELQAKFEAIDNAHMVFAAAPDKLYVGLGPLMPEGSRGLDISSQIVGKHFDGNIGYASSKEGHVRLSLDVVAGTKGRIRTHRVYPGLVDTDSTAEFQALKLTSQYVAQHAAAAVLNNGATDIAMKMTVEGPVKRAFTLFYDTYISEHEGRRTFDGDSMLFEYKASALLVFPMVFLKE